MVAEILRRRRHPEQGYRSCLGLMRLGRQYGPERLEAACARAEHLRVYSYRTVKNMLSAGVEHLAPESESDSTTPVHANIRGATYYCNPPQEEPPMLIEQTLEKINAMKLYGLAEAFSQQLRGDEYAPLSFEERTGLMIDAEYSAREQRKLTRRLRAAKLRYPSASIENIDFATPRKLNRQQVLSLASSAWIGERHNLLILGPTGIGKSFLTCAFVERACRRDFDAHYVRTPRLLHTLAVARADGSYGRLLTRLAKFDLLALDDWLIAPLKDSERRDLIEVIEERSERASTLIASQLPVTDWHAVIGDPNTADALCDRLLHNAHRLELTGHSMRKTKTPPAQTT